jgi:DNA-binding beta-propeller fold protein YncE
MPMTAVRVGTLGQWPGDLKYRPVEAWGQLPPGYRYGEVSSVAVNSRDEVFAFCRAERPVVVFDRGGNFLRSWGEGMFRRAHAVVIGPEDEVWTIDDAGHAIRKCTPEGKVLLTLGRPGAPAPPQSGEPFNLPTHLAVCPRTGTLFVTDGYGNSRVHVFDPAGRHLRSWGEPGTEAGCFNVPHGILVERDGAVYVVDRENDRIQLFTPEGRYLGQWNNLHRPNGICRDAGRERYFFIPEAATGLTINAKVPNIGARVSGFAADGRLAARIGASFAGERPGEFIAPHGVAIDSQGSLYVADVSFSVKGRHENPPREMQTLQKFVRSAQGA